MNTFYYFEGRIFETVEEVENATRNYTNKRYDEINTEKSWDEFGRAFDEEKMNGCSDGDAIEWAR